MNGDCKVCFFFQAEDGIRDVAVTGVQTCALPISGSLDTAAKIDAFSRIWTPQANTAGTAFAGGTTSQSFPSTMIDTISGTSRSEERRVGKECRPRRPPAHQHHNPPQPPASTAPRA